MRKKIIAALLGLILCLCLTISACTPKVDGNGGANGGGDNTVEDDGGNNTDGSNGSGDNTDDGVEITAMFIYVNGNRLEVALENNSATEALIRLLQQGDIIYTSYPNGFEIYGDIGHSLPTSDKWITSQTGDVLLWARSNICIFFGNNSYSYTRIGKIDGCTADGLRTALGANQSSVQVTISLK